MKAVFLDRDGVINQDRDDYVKNVSELVIYPWTPDSVRRLNHGGFQVFVVSNQQGVAKKIIREEDLRGMQDEITRQVEAAGGLISGFYYCKHLATDMCNCRKPREGMILQAAKERAVDLTQSFMVGDSERDIAAGSAAGCRTVLVLTGKLTQADVDTMEVKPDHVADDLAAAADYILSL